MAARVPSGGFLIELGGVLNIVYDLGGGVFLYYDFGGAGVAEKFDLATLGEPTERISHDQFDQKYKTTTKAVHGGTATDLLADDLQRSPTFQDWIDRRILEFTGGNTDLANNVEIRSLIVTYATGEMTEAELQGRLRQTDYWRQRTDAQREWNDLSPAEQQFRVNEAKTLLADQYFRLVGATVSLSDPTLNDWAQKYASGASGQGFIVENWIKVEALKNVESPWSRLIRAEEIAQRQHGIDIENQTQRVEQMYRRWGVQATRDVYANWARQMTENQASDDDLIVFLQGQAASQYGHVLPDAGKVETLTLVQPYMDMFSNTLEQARPDVFNTDIQKALSQGQTVFDFGQALRADDRWLATQNSRDTLVRDATEIGRSMGFIK